MKTCRCFSNEIPRCPKWNRAKKRRTHPGMTPEFACDLASGNVPQNHRLIWATWANLAVIVGPVQRANEKRSFIYITSDPIFLRLKPCGQPNGNSLTHLHPKPHIHDHCTSSTRCLGSYSTVLKTCHCHKTAGSSHQLKRHGTETSWYKWITQNWGIELTYFELMK